MLQNHEWTPGVRVWIEQAGQAIIGKGRLELLTGIDRYHSISEAARRINMSYRHAWLLVQSMNRAAAEPLVEATTGGTGGGGAALTPFGRRVISIFSKLQEQLEQSASLLLPRLAQQSSTPTVHVAAPVSLEEVLGQLLADYQLHQPTVRVRAVFGASDELAEHVLAGAQADLFLSADAQPIQRLESAGLVEPGRPTVLAENTLVAIGAENSRLSVRKPSDLLQARIARIALADQGSPLGRYTCAYLQHLGIYEAVLKRAIHADNSRGVPAIVQAGRAEAGLVYGSDVSRSIGCRLLFRARHPRPSIRYVGAVVSRGQQKEEAQELLDFLCSPSTASRFRRCGFVPVCAASH
jgi:molybdenum ABC transporter molybdate-binding protein